MNVRRCLFILCIITAITLCLSPAPAISQSDSPSYTVNIYMSPYSQTTTRNSNPSFLVKGASFYDPWMSYFPFGFNSGFGLWSDSYDFYSDISKDSPDIDESYPIKYLGHAEAITNGHLVICSGQLFNNSNKNTPISIYNIQIIDIIDATEYKKIGDLQFESESGPFGPGEVKKLLVDGKTVYILINDPAGFYVIDLIDPNAPELIHYQDLNFTSAQDMEIRNGWAFIAFSDYDSIIASWDISDHQNISFFDNIFLDGCVKDIYIDQERLLAIGDMHSGLNIIDISNPVGMDLIDHLDLCGAAVRMTGECILTAGGDHNLTSKFRIIYYKDFIDLMQVGSFNLPGMEQTVSAEGNIIYVLSNSVYTNQSQISIFLLDEETFKPEPLNIITVKGKCQNLEIYDTILMASQENQICLLDIANPSEPEKLESVRIDNSWSFKYYNNDVEEEKEKTGSLFYMNPEWPFGSFFNSFNNPFSSFYPWSFPPSIFSPPGLNRDQDLYQSRGNGPNSYSFIYNNWQLNSDPQVLQEQFGNFIQSAPWEALPLFGLITDLLRTSLGETKFLFQEGY